jgi:hypothetical protein
MKITVHVIGNVNIVYYLGLKIITTFDWLKPWVLKYVFVVFGKNK